MAGSTLSRRALVGGCIGARGVFVARADEPVDPDRMALPKIGDRLVEAGNEPGKTPLKPDDLGLHDLTLAWAFDPQTRLARDGSRLNMVLLMRFDPATLADAEREMAPGGVVGYSAVCTHQQCWVTDWLNPHRCCSARAISPAIDLRQGAKVDRRAGAAAAACASADAERWRAGGRRPVHRSRGRRAEQGA